MNWKWEQSSGWIGTFFHVANFLLSESCVWLSIIKFLSTDPFTIEYRIENIIRVKEIVKVAVIVMWFGNVVAHAAMNALIHLIMIYHHHHFMASYFIIYTMK